MSLTRSFTDLLRSPALWIGMSLSGAAVVSNLSSGQAQDEGNRSATPAIASQLKLMREGTHLLDKSAVCRGAGERLLVHLEDGDVTLITLENLASQRILKSVLDDTQDSNWIVNGFVTEFQGRNFLLLDRVMRKPKGR